MNSVFAKVAVAALAFSIRVASSPIISTPGHTSVSTLPGPSSPIIGTPGHTSVGTLPATPSVGTVQVVKHYVDITNTAVRGDMNQILTAIDASVAAQAGLIAAIKADLNSVASQFASAGTAIANSTAGVAVTLTAPEVLALVSTLSTVQLLAASLLVQYNIAKGRLLQATLVATQAEFKAALSAIKPFSDPLVAYAAQVQQQGGVAAGTTGAALRMSSAAMQQSINILLGSLGVSV
ncbi:unnamed protein product [Diplocarpon coronariae]|uniref:Glycine dehydrogenase subunit n=1 Tax=Diplocarpon coronariae TaxID=2795749 RepID=A0A218YZE3_9HELO|nr:glycine dehydrogenase subunit [Marssonina coronariae]